jgi:hypothetical protein
MDPFCTSRSPLSSFDYVDFSLVDVDLVSFVDVYEPLAIVFTMDTLPTILIVIGKLGLGELVDLFSPLLVELIVDVVE